MAFVFDDNNHPNLCYYNGYEVMPYKVVVDWLDENVKSYSFVNDSMYLEIRIPDPDDQILFKLTWHNND